MRNPESISAELSEDGVKLKAAYSSPKVPMIRLVDSNINNGSNTDQAQRVGSDPLPYE